MAQKDKSQQRTEWSEDRTAMANERTFASWNNMGLGALGIAIALKAVFGEVEPIWAGKIIATAFTILAVLIFWAANRNAIHTHKELNSHDKEEIQSKSFTPVSVGLIVATMATAVILWTI